MIQRIQSIYLLLAGILPAFTFFLPLARFYPGEGDGFFTLYGIAFRSVGLDAYAGAPTRPWGLMVLAIAMILLALATIFCYKNRKRQISLTGVIATFDVLYYLTYASYCYAFAANSLASFSFQLGALLPLVGLIFTWLARKAIRHDEELVRAADRIR